MSPAPAPEPQSGPGARPVIAYLAPELPALSATFVYQELLGLERRGFAVVPVSVRPAARPASDQATLTARTRTLYDRPKTALAAGFVRTLLRRPVRTARAAGRLLADLLSVGPWRPSAWKLAYQYLVSASLAEILIAERCSHLHVHFAHVPCQIAMYASSISGVPFTVTGHANDLFERGLLLRRKARRAARFITISEHNRQFLRAAGIPDSQLAVVRCGVSLAVRERIAPFERQSRYRLGTLGRMVEKKGMDVLLKATKALHECGMAVELSIAGDGPLRGELERLARTLGVEGAVQFEGSLTHGEVAAWMDGLDMFVLACKVDANGDMDGIPVVLMEAMSQGVPVVSTRLSGIPELIIDGETGLLAEPGDVQSLAGQIASMLADAARRTALARAAARHVAGEFGLETNLNRLQAHFNVASALQPQTEGVVL